MIMLLVILWCWGKKCVYNQGWLMANAVYTRTERRHTEWLNLKASVTLCLHCDTLATSAVEY
ncbi:hypothetical protein B7P43_G08494 [Cryptotermes secundus]|uniref:Uncharacterized protein n=1 Tax=Cryptotermes secundus TaxID=105785 RepID=A0A2J7PQG5_9NEOP|nr:hypothetical protein B7P43_G08494 [Cryptotermes secundus]